METINIIAVLVAALATFLIGGLWYSPVFFLKAWQADMGITEDKPGHPAKVFGLAYLFSVLGCAVLATFLPATPTLLEGAIIGFKIGAGFVFCSFGINYQFANRPMRALIIDGCYHITQFVTFGLILAAWP